MLYSFVLCAVCGSFTDHSNAFLVDHWPIYLYKYLTYSIFFINLLVIYKKIWICHTKANPANIHEIRTKKDKKIYIFIFGMPKIYFRLTEKYQSHNFNFLCTVNSTPMIYSAVTAVSLQWICIGYWCAVDCTYWQVLFRLFPVIFESGNKNDVWNISNGSHSNIVFG